jgi:GNAT superfamily N-acetyltransferase
MDPPDSCDVTVRTARADDVAAVLALWDRARSAAVLPGYRRRGIARRLVEFGHERLRAKGAQRVTALVADDEPGAGGPVARRGLCARRAHLPLRREPVTGVRQNRQTHGRI